MARLHFLFFLFFSFESTLKSTENTGEIEAIYSPGPDAENVNKIYACEAGKIHKNPNPNNLRESNEGTELETDLECGKLKNLLKGNKNLVNDVLWKTKNDEYIFVSKTHKVIFFDKELRVEKFAHIYKFHGKFVDYETYKKNYSRESFKTFEQFLKEEGITDIERYKIFASYLTKKGEKDERIHIYKDSKLDIDEIYSEKDNENYQYDPYKEICKTNCPKGKVFILIYNKEIIECVRNAIKDLDLNLLKPFCVCENFDLSNGYLEKSDFKCKNSYFLTNKTFENKCPDQEEKICLLPVCPQGKCVQNEGQEVTNAECSFKLEKQEKVYVDQEEFIEFEQNKVIKCLPENADIEDLEFRITLSIGCVVQKEISLPSDNQCEIISSNNNQLVLKSGCEVEAAEGELINVDNQFIKEYKLKCNSLPEKLKIEKIKCNTKTPDKNHFKLEKSCRKEIEVGQSCDYVCEKGFKFENPNSEGKITCKTAENETSIEGVLNYEALCVPVPIPIPVPVPVIASIKDKDNLYDGSINTYIIISAAWCSFIGLVIAITLIICLWKKKKCCFKSKEEKSLNMSQYIEESYKIQIIE